MTTTNRRRPVWRGPALTLLVLIVVLTVALFGLRAARAGTVLPGTTVGGVDVGGLAQPELVDALSALDETRRAREITVVRGDAELTSTAEEMGYAIDVAASAEQVMARGRQSNPLSALRDHLRAWFAPAVVHPVEAFDGAQFNTWVDEVAEALALPPIEGDIVITGTTVEVTTPSPGETIDVDALRDAAIDVLDDDGGDARIEVPTTVTTPTTTPEEVAAVAAAAERAIAAPVTLVRGEVRVSLTGAQIGAMLEVHVTGAGGLELGIDPDALLAVIPAEQFEALAQGPVDASFRLAGDRVEIVPSQDGFTFDARAAADQLVEVATGTGPRTVELEGSGAEAEFTTADAEALGIVEQVSTFTTQHPCCQSRVTNIQLMADLVRGTIVRPGETLSLNDLVGERTTGAGFVGGGAISGGEFVEQIGGGVSQFTTTMFNTIFFGGFDIVYFKPHSYYISRYPLGREATLNFNPPVDLTFTNDSPHGIYIDTSYTDTSITVTFFSTKYADVETTTGERYGFREPPEQREETDGLALGEERVVQSGRQGFSVDFTRTISYVDGRTATEHYTTVYLPEPRIIQVGTGEPAESPTPTPDPEPTSGDTTPPATTPPPPEPEPTTDPEPDPGPGPSPEPGPTSDGDGDE